MVRLSDYTWPTQNRPNVVESPITAAITTKRIPHKLGNRVQNMGTNNMLFRVSGRIYNTLTDTDKRFEDIEDLMDIFVANKPVAFTHNADHPFGEDGDNYSDYATQTEALVDWTEDGVSLQTSSSSKVGDKSIQIFNLGSGNRTLTLDNGPQNMNLNRPQFSALCFWYSPVTSLTQDFTIKLYKTSLSNYYSYEIDISDYFTSTNDWYEFCIPVGIGAQDADVVGTDKGWDIGAGSPDWENIDGLAFTWQSGASGSARIDGVCLTHAVMLNDFPSLRHPPGKPNMIGYNMQLEQYLQ